MGQPKPQDVLLELESLGAALWRVLEDSTSRATMFFDELGHEIEPSMFANVSRYHARCYLQQGGYVLKELNNNGIQIEYRGYSIKVLKSDDGGMPIPGTSHAKQCFYQQVLPITGDITVILPPDQQRNLIVCWDVDQEFGLSSLMLYRPRYGDESTARAYWGVSIPHPGDSGILPFEEIPAPHRSSDEDLDMSLLDIEQEQVGDSDSD